MSKDIYEEIERMLKIATLPEHTTSIKVKLNDVSLIMGTSAFVAILQHLQSFPSKSGWTDEDMRAVFIRFCHGQIQLMSDFEQWFTEYRKQKRGE